MGTERDRLLLDKQMNWFDFFETGLMWRFSAVFRLQADLPFIEALFSNRLDLLPDAARGTM
jgi:hypothetical protein